MQRPFTLAAAFLALASAGWAHEPKEPAPPTVVEAESDYARELAKIDRELTQAESSGSPTERVFWRYTKASLTGDPDDWNGAWHLIEEGVDAGSPRPELLLYRATIALELHRPDDAAESLDRLVKLDPLLAGGSYTKLLRGDIARARGDLRSAKQIYESVLLQEQTWEVLSRLAYLERLGGRFRKADKLYEEAQEPLTAKEMRRWAWLEEQRGMLDLDRGRSEDAEQHFQRADRAFSKPHPDRNSTHP